MTKSRLLTVAVGFALLVSNVAGPETADAGTTAPAGNAAGVAAGDTAPAIVRGVLEAAVSIAADRKD